MIEIEARVPGHDESLRLLGVDVLLAGMDELLGLSGLVADWVDPKASSRTMAAASRSTSKTMPMSIMAMRRLSIKRRA